MAVTHLRNRSLWSKIPGEILSLIKVETKARHDQVGVAQSSAQNFEKNQAKTRVRAIWLNGLNNARISTFWPE